MDLKTQDVIVNDCNTAANAILRDINDIDTIERMIDCELSSEDLFKIDSAILNSLRNTTDFSRDLLKQLEKGYFEYTAVKHKSIDEQMAEIQQNTMIDITMPLQNMFNEMADYVSEAFI